MSLLDALERKENFTETDVVLADYVLKHADDVAEMSIGQLATITYTSNAAVVRFCHRLGLGGYRDFRIALARDLERARTHVLEVNPDQPFFEDIDTRDIMSLVAALSKQAIDATYDDISAQDVRKAARLIVGARRVALYGIGDTLVSLEVFRNLVLKLGISCIKGFEHSESISVAQMLDVRDVAIIATYSGDLVRTYAKTIKLLRASGCKTILITADGSLESELVGTDCFFLLPRGETRSDRVATYFSEVSIRYVLNCIYGEIFSRNYQENMRRRESYAEMYQSDRAG